MYPNLVIAMRKRKLPQRQLAEQIGISESAMCKKMTGKSDFTLPEAQAIAAVLGRSVDTLFAEESSSEIF